MGTISRRGFLAGAAGVLAWGSASWSTARGATMTAKLDVERFIEDLERANGESEPQAAVDAVLARTVSDPAAVLAGLGEPGVAGLHTIHHSPELTVLNVVWAPLMLLMPHNHEMWASIAIYTGREDNILWQRKGAVVEAIGARSLSEKEVFALPEDAIHSVTNPIRRLTGAIHVYGGDFFEVEGRSEWDPDTLSERALDLGAAQDRFRDASERFESSR